MLSVAISEKGGAFKRQDFSKSEITIGRVQGNDIILSRENVSKKHARVVERDGKIVILDLKSTNGTYVNGKRISSPQVIQPQDKIQIGDFVFLLSEGRSEDSSVADRLQAASEALSQWSMEEGAGEGEATSPEAAIEAPPNRLGSAQAARSSKVLPESRAVASDGLQREIHNRLIKYLDLKRMAIERLGDEELWDKTERAVRNIIAQMESAGEIPTGVDIEILVKDVLNESLGLGPLEDFLSDPTVSEIMVNGAKQIYVEREGLLELTHKTFSSDQAVIGVIERIVAPLGRRIDESVPLVDARLKDGSRVNAIIPPLAIKGPCITIRKFKEEVMSVQDLIRLGTFTAQTAEFMELCVRLRKNIIVSGGTGSGKTTTLNCLSAYIPETERIVTIEDAAELKLHQEHWVTLESRPPNIEGKGQITIRDLVRNTLRMRPDRIVVGECRGGEALDMLQAMNTGHDGSLTTIHANSPRDSLSRLETMVLMAGMDLPVRAIREQIASAVDIIIHQARFSDGSRRITHVTEVTGMEGDVITLQNIFVFKQEGFDQNNRVKGRFVATGFVPKFFDDLQNRGIPVNLEIFREQ